METNNIYQFKKFKYLLLILVFLAVCLIHFFWTSSPPINAAQSEWVEIESELSRWDRYITSLDYFLGFTYGLSFSFTTAAFFNYYEKSLCSSKKFIFGSLSFSGGLSFLGCFLIGCCGSPMLLVYTSFLGMRHASLAKPLIALITSIIISIVWYRMWKRSSVETTCNIFSISKKGSDDSCC